MAENLKVVLLSNHAAATASVFDVISCKNAHKVWFVVHHSGANNTDATYTLTEYTAVGGSASTVTETCPIWLDADAGAASDTLVRQTDAAAVVIDPATQNPVLFVMEWDPAKHTAGYDCITLVLGGAGGHASNIVSAYALIAERYPQATPPSAIID
jgi:hypothetical protein